MASIFTYDPDPPRVSSPWSTPRTATPQEQSNSGFHRTVLYQSTGSDEATEVEDPPSKLEAEPQQGSTEYKLHLLLRPRRTFSFVSTAQHVSGSQRLKFASQSPSGSSPGSAGVSQLAASSQSRQHRLEQLTTQLLWRLQQSSPFHATAGKPASHASLAETAAADPPVPPPRKLLPGLEDSKGALYEIGVSDDGTFVGLAEDEMDESLNNLRAMAARLGCQVNVLRMVSVGECRWPEEIQSSSVTSTQLRASKLWVAEAFVKPGLDARKLGSDDDNPEATNEDDISTARAVSFSHGDSHVPTLQLRVSLTGASGSGKSSLLGTLSTATLDNGRGKSRLSLLKHRHEIASGVTTSVTQELIGYHNTTDSAKSIGSCQVVNYACGNVSSWTDIHAASESGRLVFLCDSAGHPRYRRTIVRGLIGWAPHWTLICVAADAAGVPPGAEPNASAYARDEFAATGEADHPGAHLDLCLKLDLPLVVVITKLDLASKSSLRRTLAGLLSPLKAAGRKPIIISDAEAAITDPDLGIVSAKDLSHIRRAIGHSEGNHTPFTSVPIVLTSVVKGTGISKLHALLRELPIPGPSRPVAPISGRQFPSPLFHIEDVFTFSGKDPPMNTAEDQTINTIGHDRLSVIGGHLRYGRLAIGDELVIGPYATNPSEIGPQSLGNQLIAPTSDSRDLNPSSPLPTLAEWRPVRVVSIRALRLPVRGLSAGQVGTIGVEPLQARPTARAEASPAGSPAGLVRIRKGMVLTESPGPCVRNEFVSRFASADWAVAAGSPVVVYVASVRASAKVVAVRAEAALGRGLDCGSQEKLTGVANPTGDDAGHNVGDHVDEEGGFAFGFEAAVEDDRGEERGEGGTHVTFRLIAAKEFIEVGAQVLVMPSGGPGEKGVAELEGFVGRVVGDQCR